MKVIFKEKLRRNIGYFVAEFKNNDQAKQRRKQKRDIEKEKKAKQLSFANPYDNLQRSSGEETYENPNDDEVTSVEAKKSEAKAKAKKAFLQRRSLMNKEGSKLTTKKCLEFAPCYETMEGVLIRLDKLLMYKIYNRLIFYLIADLMRMELMCNIQKQFMKQISMN
jgi:hypothetical protein